MSDSTSVRLNIFICRNIQWEKDGSSDIVTLEYPYISVHGVSTDTSNFPHQCVFCLVDAVLPGKCFSV